MSLGVRIMESKSTGLARLGFWDVISLIIGIIIGVGIFYTPSTILQSVGSPQWALVLWVVGGLFALIGAFCFAELACSYPRSGGEYVYLTHAYGPLIGYLFAWAQLSVIRPATICAYAYIFADSAALLWPGADGVGVFVLSGAIIILLTAVNVLGVYLGTTTQHILTGAKMVGLFALVAIGLLWGSHGIGELQEVQPVTGTGGIAGALVYILWTYAGWHEAAYVVAEVKDHRRNIPAALLLGTIGVIVIYVLVNISLVVGLGFAGARGDNAAENIVALIWPGWGAKVMAVLIMVSALSGLNGFIFTTARIYSEFGSDHAFFTPLSRWSKTWHTPARALIAQTVVSLACMAGVWVMGQRKDPFEVFIYLTAAVFWSFFLLTGIALFRLRYVEPERERPFRVPWYPVLPILFCLMCAYMVYGSIREKPVESLGGLGILLAGVPFYFWPKKKKQVSTPISLRVPEDAIKVLHER